MVEERAGSRRPTIGLILGEFSLSLFVREMNWVFERRTCFLYHRDILWISSYHIQNLFQLHITTYITLKHYMDLFIT